MNSILAFAIICQLANTGRLPKDPGQQILCAAIQQTLPFMLFPRFVLSLRKLYARDIGNRRGDGLDSAFGLPTLTLMPIFVGTVRNVEQEDDIELEYREPVAHVSDKTTSEG